MTVSPLRVMLCLLALAGVCQADVPPSPGPLRPIPETGPVPQPPVPMPPDAAAPSTMAPSTIAPRIQPPAATVLPHAAQSGPTYAAPSTPGYAAPSAPTAVAPMGPSLAAPAAPRMNGTWGAGPAAGAGPFWAPGGYDARVGSPYYYHDPNGGQYVVTGNPYNDHFGPGFHRQSLHGHYRFPYYNYRAPWYYPGRAVYNRDTNFPW